MVEKEAIMRIKRKVRSIATYRRSRAERYAVILAGGEGTRLRPITQAIAGDDRPKQFCTILDGETLLDRTRKRASADIPAENTFFSLTRKHERFYAPLLRDVREDQKVIQPEGRGTAPAILYSLVRIAKIDPNAVVAFFPSDHYFSDDAAFMDHVTVAFDMAASNTDSIVLLGIEAEKPETSYGWIEPSRSFFGDLTRAVSRVQRFWEKPTIGVANHLFEAGCLWNSFVMVGRVGTFLDMFKQHLPELYRMFSAASNLMGTTQESAVIRSIYDWIEDVNFSSEVLERSAEQLLVMRVRNVGWSDWGEPERVIGTLNNLGVRPQWLQALAA
jgi:mannose-1-phosphate guanylyltransferase